MREYGLTGWLARHPLGSYFCVTFLWSWMVAVPLALRASGVIALRIPFALHYLASFGPLVAATLVTWTRDGRSGVQQLYAGLARWQVGWRWWLAAVGTPIALFALATAWMALRTDGVLNLAALGDVDYVPRLGLGGALLLWLITFGIGEEVGWRGFALPRLQAHHTALTAALLLSLPWAAWHLPAFFYRDSYRAMGLVGGVPMMWLSLAAASIVFTWLFNGTCGSLLVVAVFHGLFDLLSVSTAGGTAAATVMSAGVMAGAVVVVVRCGPARLGSVKVFWEQTSVLRRAARP